MQHSSHRLSRNNFDLLRLLFAGTVCLVHAYQLSGQEQLAWVARFLSSAVAVKAFFVVSGFLIFMSFERSSSTASYASKRIRRIYPAYFTVVILSAVLLFFASESDLRGYFSSEWLKYIAANLVFLNFAHPSLPGVFQSNTLTAVNGALWTLKIEVMFYASVPLFVYLMRRFGRLATLGFFYCSSVIYAVALSAVASRTGSALYAELARQLPGQLSYFMAGAFFYYFLPAFERYVTFFVGTALLVLAVNLSYPLPLFEPFALATAVVFFGLFSYLGKFGRYGDFSYGVYIIHFPVIQLFVQFGWLRDSPSLYLASAGLVTLLAAMAMWHLVEKPFLLRNSHYLSVNTPKQGEHCREVAG